MSSYKHGYKNEINYSRGNRPLNWKTKKANPDKPQMPDNPVMLANCTKCNDAWYASTKQTVLSIQGYGYKCKCNDCGTENYHEPSKEQRKNLRYPHFNGCLGQIVKSKEDEAALAKSMGMTLTEDQYY